MEPKSSLNLDSPLDLNIHHPVGSGAAIVPEPNTSQQSYNNAVRRKSKVRLNDQLIPKPTDINMMEKMIKTATHKEHPYSSHISKFAMFPSFRSPDDPLTGVRAASQPFLNPLIPNSAPDVTLLSKTMGSPYRHEILETPMKTRKKAVMWAGHGFLDHTKPLKGDNQGFYPTPPTTVMPNPQLRDWDMSLSERTCNMLKNLEKAHWITSYQMDYTGSGPANPLKTDDFNEKANDTGRNSHVAPLREKSFPVFVPSKPRQGCRRRQWSRAAELPNRSPAPNQDRASASVIQNRPQEILAENNEAPHPHLRGQSQSKHSSGFAEAELSREVLHKQQTEGKSSAYEGRERKNGKVQFDESPMRVSVSQSSQEANVARIADTARPLDLISRPHYQGEMEVNREKSPIELCAKDEPNSKKENFSAGKNVSSFGQSAVAKDLSGAESPAELLSGAASEQEELAQSRELPRSISNPCILPRPPVLPGIRPVDSAGALGRGGAALSLTDVQNSFSKTMTHHNFNNSVTHAPVNLRDNVVTGKKHNFYGINCYYLHG